MVWVRIVHALPGVNVVPTPNFPSALSWGGIQPGVTKLSQALATMNEPDEIREDGEFTVYRYEYDQPVYGHIELWMLTEEIPDATIVAIWRTIPYIGLVAQEPDDVLPLIWEYGRPDFVGWGVVRYNRFLIWATRGIVVEVSAGVDFFSWQELGYYYVLIFKPMTVEEFFATSWPWPLVEGGFPQENLYPNGDRPDIYPRDPYDWEHLPTPPP